MNHDLPVKFLWGAFCRRGIVDSNTGTASMIDIIPSVRINSQIGKEMPAVDLPQALHIPFGGVAAFALFGRTEQNPSKEPQKFEDILTVNFTIPGVSNQPSEAPIKIEPDQDSTFIIFSFENSFISVPFAEGSYKQFFDVEYTLKEFSLGKISLTVYITVEKE